MGSTIEATDTTTRARSLPGEARSERLNARLTPRQKAMLDEAAALEGRSLTDFVADAIQEKALATVRAHRIWDLTAAQSLAFAESLLRPGEPTAEQRARYARYRQAVVDRAERREAQTHGVDER